MGYDYCTKGETELKLPFLVKNLIDPFTKNRWPFVYFHQVWSSKLVYVSSFDMHKAFKRGFYIEIYKLEHVSMWANYNRANGEYFIDINTKNSMYPTI